MREFRGFDYRWSNDLNTRNTFVLTMFLFLFLFLLLFISRIPSKQVPSRHLRYNMFMANLLYQSCKLECNGGRQQNFPCLVASVSSSHRTLRLPATVQTKIWRKQRVKQHHSHNFLEPGYVHSVHFFSWYSRSCANLLHSIVLYLYPYFSLYFSLIGLYLYSIIIIISPAFSFIRINFFLCFNYL